MNTGNGTIITPEDLKQFDQNGALCWQKAFPRRLPMAESIVDYYTVLRKSIILTKNVNGYIPEIKIIDTNIGQGCDNPEAEARKYVIDGLEQINHNMRYVNELYLILFSRLHYKKKDLLNGVELSYLIKSEDEEETLPFIKSIGTFKTLEKTVYRGNRCAYHPDDIYKVEVEITISFPNENNIRNFQKQMAYLQGLAQWYNEYKQFLVYPIKENANNK